MVELRKSSGGRHRGAESDETLTPVKSRLACLIHMMVTVWFGVIGKIVEEGAYAVLFRRSWNTVKLYYLLTSGGSRGEDEGDASPPPACNNFLHVKNTVSNRLLREHLALFPLICILLIFIFILFDQVPSAVELLLQGVRGTLHVLSSIAGFISIYCRSCWAERHRNGRH